MSRQLLYLLPCLLLLPHWWGLNEYENFDKLTIAMLNEFIEKILVHERDRKGSIQTCLLYTSLDRMRDNTTYVRNIKKYLLAALYNAPATIDSYYAALVNHDLYGSGERR